MTFFNMMLSSIKSVILYMNEFIVNKTPNTIYIA